MVNWRIVGNCLNLVHGVKLVARPVVVKVAPWPMLHNLSDGSSIATLVGFHGICSARHGASVWTWAHEYIRNGNCNYDSFCQI